MFVLKWTGTSASIDFYFSKLVNKLKSNFDYFSI